MTNEPKQLDFFPAEADAARALKRESIAAVSAEVVRARKKFPGNRFLLAALTEEVGELAKALLQRAQKSDVDKEAIQVACVAIRLLEEGDASFEDITADEAKP